MFEVSIRGSGAADGGWGFYLADADRSKTFELSVLCETRQALVSWPGNTETLSIKGEFDPEAYHLLRVEADGRFLRFSLDETSLQFETMLEKSSTSFGLTAKNAGTSFSGFALTKGFEDLFDRPGTCGRSRLAEGNGRGQFSNRRQELLLKSGSETVVAKGEYYENYEFAVNIRVAELLNENGYFAFIHLDENDQILQRFLVQRSENIFYLDSGAGKNALPDDFDPANYHQFRFLKTGGRMIVQLEDEEIARNTRCRDQDAGSQYRAKMR